MDSYLWVIFMMEKLMDKDIIFFRMAPTTMGISKITKPTTNRENSFYPIIQYYKVVSLITSSMEKEPKAAEITNTMDNLNRARGLEASLLGKSKDNNFNIKDNSMKTIYSLIMVY